MLPLITRRTRVARGNVLHEELPMPPVTVVCHGDTAFQHDAHFLRVLHANEAPIDRIVWTDEASAIKTVREEMEIRGDRYLVLIDTRTQLGETWLDELVRCVEWGPSIGAATFVKDCSDLDGARFTADARCTLLALRKFPAHERLHDLDTLDGAIADFLIRGLQHRCGTRAAEATHVDLPPLAVDEAFERRHGITVMQAIGAGRERFEPHFAVSPRRREGLVSIVMLSWNAPQFTKIALESIRAHTGGPYEIIIVDNGSGPETVEWLRTLDDVRIIYNATNRGYAGGNNQAIAAARGEYVVLLNNDVVVTEGWLDGLLAAFDRIPGLGVSAPRSNKIAGDQIVTDAAYGNLDQMHQYAAGRRARYRDRGYMTDRAIGLCLCIDRRVIDEIGGIDERFAVGNYEDDDFCLRVRAAGYRIFVCDDVFIHHFGSQTFAANKVDWTATMRENWDKFAEKWSVHREPGGGYVPGPAIRRGFSKARHFVPLPVPDAEPPYRLTFAAVVRDERDWNQTAAFARRYLRTFDAGEDVCFAIACLGDPCAQIIGARLERLAQREGLQTQLVADVDVSDEEELAPWLSALRAPAVCRLDDAGDPLFDKLTRLEERSPSALRRLFAQTSAV